MESVKRWEPRNTSLGYDMQPKLDGAFVLACDFDRIKAENLALQLRLNAADQRNDELGASLKDLISAVRSINRSPAYKVKVIGDDEPQYRQRKEWIDWVLELCEKASAGLEQPAPVAVVMPDLDDHDRSGQNYWADQAAQGKPYEQQLREACERNGIDPGLDDE